VYEVKPVAKEKTSVWDTVAFWLDKAQSIAFLVGACLALLFVFSIGGTFAGESVEIFYYFGDVYQDVKELCQINIEPFTNGWKAAVSYVYAGIGTLSMALTLVLTVIFACLAIYSYVKNFRRIVTPNRHKWAIATVTTYFVGSLIFKLLENVSEGKYSFAFNGATESGFAWCGIFLLFGCALGVAKQGKSALETRALTKYIIGAVGILFGAIALGFTGSITMTISGTGEEVSMSLWSWARTIVMGVAPSELYVAPNFELAVIGYLLTTALAVATAFVVGKNFAVKIRNFADGGNNSGLSIAIVGFILAVLQLVLLIVSNNFAASMVVSEVKWSFGGAITLVVFASLSLVASIVQKVVCSQKQA
jgi:hypothetical protein